MKLFRSAAGGILVATVVFGGALALLAVLALADGVINSLSYDVVVAPAVYDSDTKAPVPNCLITVDDGLAGAAARTDADGRAKDLPSYRYLFDNFFGGRWLASVDRRRRPTLLLYLGEAPHQRSLNGTSYRDTEAWNVRLRFWSPRLGADGVAAVDVERTLRHIEWSRAGLKLRTVSRTLPDRLQTLPQARVHIEPLERQRSNWPFFDYHGVYRIRLSLYLDRAQAATCESATMAEKSALVDSLLAGDRYTEALEELHRFVAEQPQEYASDYGRIAICLAGLGREREAIATARKAAGLTVWGRQPLPVAPIQGESGDGLLDHGRYQEAAEYFKKLAAANKVDPRAFVGLGSSLYEMGRCAEAADAFDASARVGSTWQLPDASRLRILGTCGKHPAPAHGR